MNPKLIYLKQVVIYKNELTPEQENKLKALLTVDNIKINGRIVFRPKINIHHEYARKEIIKIMKCPSSKINLIFENL